MFNSTIIDVAIGMIFVYLLLSLICSAANEIIELQLKNRAADLERGIRELFNDPNRTTGMVEKIYEHPLISGLFEKSYDPSVLTRWKRMLGKLNLPSYIPARNFALAMMDISFGKEGEGKPTGGAVTPSGVAGATPPSTTAPNVVVNMGATVPTPPPDPNALNALRNNVQSIPNEQVKKAMNALIDAADNDPAKVRENIENWYNSSMDRVSGWYKRRTQSFLLLIAFFVAIAVNADSIQIGKRLWSDKPLRESLVAAADAYAKANAATPSPTATPKPSPIPTSTPKPGTSPPQTELPREDVPPPKGTPSPSPCQSAKCKEKPDSDDCRREAIKCEKEDCWRGACPAGPNDPSPMCKLRKNQCEIENLGLPLGWSPEDWPGFHFWTKAFWSGWLGQFRLHIFGWLLTALAISLGAPFWFDMLNKFIVVRSTVKPKEKSPEEKSKD